MAATAVPQFTLAPSAWDILVNGEHRGIVVNHSWHGPGPKQFFATHAGKSVYASTRADAVMKLLAALETEQ